MKILSPRNKLFIFFALVLAITVITISAYAIDDQPVSSFDMTNPHAISGYYLKDTGGPAVGIPVEVHIIVCVGVVPPCVNYSCTSNVSIDTLDNGGYEYAFSTDYNEFYFDAYPTLECDTAIGSGDRVWTTANGTSVYCIDGISTETLISAGQTTFVENVTLVNCSEPWSPNVTLIWPPDGYDTKNGTVPFTYNVTDDSEVDNCSLIFNGSIIQTNHTIEVNQTLNITPPKLKNGKYNWSINCTDEWGNEGASESRILNVSKIGRIQIHYTNPPNNSKVDQYSFFFLTAELNCIDGMCGTINSTTFVLSSPNPTMMLPITPALPFYTISDNPLEADDFSCMTFMHEDDVCTIAWDVNASGNIYNNSQFHAWANSTQYAKVHNVSPPINLTIWDLREPIVVLVNADPSTIAQKNWTNITANITDNTVVDTALVNITAPDGSWYVYPMIPTGGDVWYYVYNTTLYTLPGLYNATVIANDTFGNVNDTEWATFTVEDKTAPEWSNNKTSPDSGSEYAPGKDYQFNLTWTDNIQVDDVIIEHNLTGSIQNITVTDRVGDEYYYDFSDLPAGEYYWKEYANDTSNNFNATPVWVYIVEKADPVPLMNLSLNGNQTNLTQVYGTNTVADSLKSFTEGSLDLYRNGTLIDSGQTPSDTTLLPVGYYNYTLIYEETQNYTYGDKTLMANIVPAIPILTLDVTGGWNQTYPAATTVNCTADTNQVDPKLYIDGIEIINPYSIQHAADNYNYTCNVTTTQNYTSAQVSNELIINKNISSCSLLFAPSPPQIYPQSVKANCTCTNPEEDEYMTRDSVDVTTENNIFVPLPAGFLNYNCSVPETQNYTYAQAIGLYTLQKNITAINLTINGQDSNVTVVWNSTVNYNVSLLPIDDIAGLYDNNLLLTNSLTPFNFSKYYRHIGTHEITANYTGNQNYTNSTDTHYLHVVDIVPPNVTLHEPEDGYWNDSTRFVNVTFNCSTYDDYNLSTVSLYLTDRNNNSFSPAIIENIEGTYNLSNWTIELHAGDYTWNCFVNDTSGNEGWGINRSFDLNFSIPLIGVVLVKNIWYEEDDNDTIVYRIDNTIHNYA
ncbi:hypothetical protein HQ545_07460, partial [Candidatus Woesearchaeota archaeon]|nr:hypothetical protein [Candidatus Woesearchaeota archaeon]